MPLNIPLKFDSKKHEKFWKKFIEVFGTSLLAILLFGGSYIIYGINPWWGAGFFLWAIFEFIHFLKSKK